MHGKSEKRKGIINQQLNLTVSEEMKSLSATPCKLHLIKTGNVEKQLLHWCVPSIFPSLCDSLASVKAWDYAKIALAWVSTLRRHLHHERCIKRERKNRF